MAKIKINIYTYKFSRGGMENTLINFVNEFKDEYDIKVYATHTEDDTQFDYERYGFLKDGKKHSLLRKFLTILSIRFLKSDADVNLCWNTYFSTLAKKVSKFNNNAIWVHTDLGKSGREDKFYKKCSPEKYKKVVFISRASLRKYKGNNGFFVHNLIEKPRHISNKKDKKVINVARHMNIYKDLNKYMSIASINSDVQFDQIGTGPDYDKNIINSKEIKNINWLGISDSYDHYKNYSHFILTSKVEGFPIVIMEALTHNLIVWTTNVVEDFNEPFWKDFILLYEDIEEIDLNIKPLKKLTFDIYNNMAKKGYRKLVKELN